MHFSHSQSEVKVPENCIKFGGIAAGRLYRGMVIEPVWLAPFESVKHMGYK